MAAVGDSAVPPRFDNPPRTVEELLGTARFVRRDVSLPDLATPPFVPPGWQVTGRAAVNRGPSGLFATPQQIHEALRGPPPPANHPYMQYVNSLKAGLVAAGLSAEATGVRIVVAGEASEVGKPLDPHGSAVLQTIGGAIGLAQNAGLQVALQSPLPPLPSISSFTQVGVFSRALMLRTLNGRQTQLADIISRLPPGRKDTTLVNMSQGLPLSDVVKLVLQPMMNAPPGSQLNREATDLLGHAPRPGDEAALGKIIAAEVHKALDSAPVAAARAALEQQVADGRDAGVLIFKASGNDRRSAEQLGNPADAEAIDAVKGMVLVGAIDLGRNALDPSDDTVAPFSVQGPVLGAVGMSGRTFGPHAAHAVLCPCLSTCSQELLDVELDQQIGLSRDGASGDRLRWR